jgi:hypothetical protein
MNIYTPVLRHPQGMNELAIAELLALQSGVISRPQVLAAGGCDHDIARHLRRRIWARIHDGVYVDHTGEPSWKQRAWAAVLYYWPARPGRRLRPDGPRRSSHWCEAPVHAGRGCRRSHAERVQSGWDRGHPPGGLRESGADEPLPATGPGRARAADRGLAFAERGCIRRCPRRCLPRPSHHTRPAPRCPAAASEAAASALASFCSGGRDERCVLRARAAVPAARRAAARAPDWRPPAQGPDR